MIVKVIHTILGVRSRWCCLYDIQSFDVIDVVGDLPMDVGFCLCVRDRMVLVLDLVPTCRP